MDDSDVARLRLPISIDALIALDHALEITYGPGLLIEGNGEWLVVSRPEGASE